MFSLLFALACLSGTLGQCPSKVLESGVIGADQATTINQHNYWRTQLAQGRVPKQPKASNMLRMKWDPALAVTAQKLTNTCVFAHIRETDSRWTTVGQNLFKQSSTVWYPGANWTQAINSWFGEVVSFVYPNVTIVGKETSHYKQVAWAKTYAVGCGYVAWVDKSGTRPWYNKLYACNYGPGGCIAKQAPYLTGPGCENLCNPPA